MSTPTPTMAMIYPPHLERGQLRTVVIQYANFDPNLSAVNCDTGVVGDSDAVCGQLVAFDYTPPASGDSVTFTDAIVGGGISVVVPLIDPATTALLLPVELKLADDQDGIDPDAGFLLSSGNGPNGATIIRTDTGESVGPPDGTPWLHDAVGRYHFIIPSSVGPTYLAYYRATFNGVVRFGRTRNPPTGTSWRDGFAAPVVEQSQPSYLTQG